MLNTCFPFQHHTIIMAYTAMASFLIIDHQVSQHVKAEDVIDHLKGSGIITYTDQCCIMDGATKKIKSDRLLAKVKVHGVEGYVQLRIALLLAGAKYKDLVAAIDKLLPPRDMLAYRNSTCTL